MPKRLPVNVYSNVCGNLNQLVYSFLSKYMLLYCNGIIHLVCVGMTLFYKAVYFEVKIEPGPHEGRRTV